MDEQCNIQTVIQARTWFLYCWQCTASLLSMNAGCVCHVKKVCCGKRKKRKKQAGEERDWSHMGTSKQAGVEFQQCGKQQTLQSVQEETSVAGVPVRCGSRAVFPGSDGRTVGGLTPQSYRKQGWSRNTNKHSQPCSVLELEDENSGQRLGPVLTRISGVCCWAAGDWNVSYH